MHCVFILTKKKFFRNHIIKYRIKRTLKREEIKRCGFISQTQCTRMTQLTVAFVVEFKRNALRIHQTTVCACFESSGSSATAFVTRRTRHIRCVTKTRIRRIRRRLQAALTTRWRCLNTVVSKPNNNINKMLAETTS